MAALTPAQVAVRDQGHALVRDLAATGLPVLLIDLAQGETCCWCNCPAAAADSFVCGGCTAPADAVLRISPPPEVGDVYPVCRAHRDDALAVIELLMASLAVPG
jgi:hypothetical protein